MFEILVCINPPFKVPSVLKISLNEGALVTVSSVPEALSIPINPLFKVFGSISNSGAVWQPAQPTPPAVLTPEPSKVGGAKNSCLPVFSSAVKFEKGVWSSATATLPVSYFESKD